MTATWWLWSDPPLKRLQQRFCAHRSRERVEWPPQQLVSGGTRTAYAYWCTDCGKKLPPECEKCMRPLW